MNHSSLQSPINTNAKFELSYHERVRELLRQEPVHRGAAHAMRDKTTESTHELLYITDFFQVDPLREAWVEVVKPNLPWAEDHFQERIGGEPLNPSPSEAWWPFARQGNAEHKKDQVFSHTYPERFWPRLANKEREYEELMSDMSPEPISRIDVTDPHWGIRYSYGDFNDLIGVLNNNPNTRQAYLPIWFPEDLTAAHEGDRVPCSLGYHFLRNGATGKLDCVYTLRSCDIVRFYRDDVYMAGRLLQVVTQYTQMSPGKLVVHIDNLHCFPGDRPHLELQLSKVKPDTSMPWDNRVNYDFGAL